MSNFILSIADSLRLFVGHLIAIREKDSNPYVDKFLKEIMKTGELVSCSPGRAFIMVNLNNKIYTIEKINSFADFCYMCTCEDNNKTIWENMIPSRIVSLTFEIWINNQLRYNKTRNDETYERAINDELSYA